MIEKFEVNKNSRIIIYTGALTNLKDGWVKINTTRGETLRFRKEQIEGREELKGSELKNENSKKF